MRDEDKGMSRLAVVILNWNGEGFLRRFLPRVVEYSTGDYAPQGCEVVVAVADNASADGSLGWLSDTYVSAGDDRVRVIALDANYGFTGGYNRALAHETLAGFDSYLLLNSDVDVTPGWLVPLAAILTADARVGAVMPKLLAYGREDYFEYAGACGGFIDALGYPFCRGRIFGTVEKDRGQYDTVRDIFWASGAAMLVRADLWRELGGLDEAFFAHMEEIDFCWRLHRQGFRVVVCPESAVYHVGGGALPATSPRKTYLNFRNNLAMLYKNLSHRLFAAVYFVRFWADGLQALGYLATGKSSFAGAVFRGHADFWLRMREKMVRRTGSGGYALPPKEVLYRGSVAWRYVFGWRTFGNMM
ncbi:glycosyltransferase family 2 protein [uncultured Rikenella sp.]|uniref:glycosyltransferase family 2 protein n=1 Tax=uncultured Rikenella sp. TaxID=368003 RepID=UPI0026026B9B|nr:glycosyltransferase family 2 protein [uncultured Rikenella sp.]